MCAENNDFKKTNEKDKKKNINIIVLQYKMNE